MIVELPVDLAAAFGGPRHGIGGLRRRAGADGRALTCSALKPQGLAPARLAAARRAFRARAGSISSRTITASPTRLIPRSPNACPRLRCRAVRGTPTRYVPSLSGDLDAMRAPGRRSPAMRHRHGDDRADDGRPANFAGAGACISPTLRSSPIPTHGGAARIAPALLIGKLFRLLGADAVIFPNLWRPLRLYAGDLPRALPTRRARRWRRSAAQLPVPAGGMTLDRVPEMLDFYGADVMLLIGGSLLPARESISRGEPPPSRAPSPRTVIGRGSWTSKPPPGCAPLAKTIAGTASTLHAIQGGRQRAVQGDHAPGAVLRAGDLGCELRYFEMAPGGYSTLERHEHMHAVMILRGHGHCLLGGEVRAVEAARPRHHPRLDLASVPRDRRRAARLPLHGEPRARQAAVADRRGAGGAGRKFRRR